MHDKLTVPDASPLLAGFEEPSLEDWQRLASEALRGKGVDTLSKRTPEGMTIRPLYTAADAGSPAGLPGFKPYVRGAKAAGSLAEAWEISQEITCATPEAFNAAAAADLERGLSAINLVVDRATRCAADPDWAEPGDVGIGGLSVASLEDLRRAFSGIDLARVSIFARTGSSALPFAALLVALARRRGFATSELRGCIEMDPLGVLAHDGALPQSMAGAYREMALLTAWAIREAPRLQTVCVHTRAWHEGGGHAVHELGFGLAAAAEYLRALDERGIPVDAAAPRIRLALTMGVDFFTGLAKVRAARALWAQLIAAFGGGEAARRAAIHIRTDHYSKTLFDPHLNLVRAATEALAGALAGCDSMQVGAFDEIGRAPDEFSRRLARNVQLILQKECRVHRVIDPAGGSWYVESLTRDLAQRGWELFREIEQRGGLMACMTTGWAQQAVAETAARRLADVASRRTSIVGTNRYAAPREEPLAPASAEDAAALQANRCRQISNERLLLPIESDLVVVEHLDDIVSGPEDELFEHAVSAMLAGATLGEVSRALRILDRDPSRVAPVRPQRAAGEFERLRLAVLRHEPGFRVYLANLGPPAQHRARADFSRGFFETAGCEVEVPAGAASPAEAAQAAAASGARIVVICSTDESYAVDAVPLARAFKAARPDARLVLAGHPGEHEAAFRAAGIDEFIHLKGNALETMIRLFSSLGVPL